MDPNTFLAQNKDSLRKRLLRFFSNESNDRQEINEFLDLCYNYGNPLIFGGCVRDIAIFGVRQFASDIDIVFDGDKENLRHICNSRDFSKNKYGGYRGKLKNWDIDIWPICETWAFRNGFIEYEDESSLLETTIMNWDSIIFDWNEKKIICGDDYFNDLKDGFLDIVLTQNPNELGATVKILRTIVLKGTLSLSSGICHFLSMAFDRFSYADILKKEVETYRGSFINERVLKYIEVNAKIGEASILPMPIDQFYYTEKLI